MKLMHLGDLHLGKTLGDYNLIDDQEYILEQILSIAKEREVDALLIAGDVYDKAQPSEEAVRLLDTFLYRLAENGIEAFIISGNHDSDERLNFGRTFFSNKGIHIYSKYEGKLMACDYEKEGVKVKIWLMPYIKASQVRRFYPEEKIDNYGQAVRTVIEHSGVNREDCNILVAHQFVTGKGSGPALSGSESLGTQNVGLVEKIGYDGFKDFAYVALGHIHSPQHVGRTEIRYAGSPLKYSLSEANNRKSVPIITIDGKENVKVDLIPLKPMRDLRHIRGPIRELIDKANVVAPDDFIYVTLTDEEIINDAMGIIRQVYPNTVKIDYDNSRTREIEQIDISKIAKNRSFDELIGDFYRQMYGCEISGEEMDLMRTVAREAGVIHEAD